MIKDTYPDNPDDDNSQKEPCRIFFSFSTTRLASVITNEWDEVSQKVLTGRSVNMKMSLTMAHATRRANFFRRAVDDVSFLVL